MSLWKGLVGNARVARASRGVERIWNDPASTLRVKVCSLMEGLDTIGWELDPITSENEEFSYLFSSLRPRLPSLLPEDISFSYSAGIGMAHASPTIVRLRGLRLIIEGAAYEITKRGLLGFSDSGSASLAILFDLDISLETSGHPKVRVDVEKQDIALETSRKPDSVVGKVWNGWLSTLVRAKFAESIDERIRSAFEAWVDPFYNAPAASTASADPSASLQVAAKAPDAIHTVGKSPLPSASGPMGARAAFLASLRMTSGVSARPLATGREVLDSLENPFGSGPNSAAMGDGNDDEEGSSSGGLKSRRMSMAMSLTDLSRGDATALDTIANPPRAQSQPHVALDEPPASSSLTARRLSLAYTPAGEPSLEAYDSEYATAASSIDPPILGSGREQRRSTVMADSLDAKAEADGTTLEGMLATADRANTLHGFDGTRDVTSGRQNISMTKSKIRRKSMSEYLTEAAAVDTTDPTAYPGPRRALAYDPGLQDQHRPFMSEALDATSSIDTTLPEHIASPPRSRHSSFATGAFVGAGVNTGPLPRNRTKSFVKLSDVPTMAELGIDKDVIRDETDVTALPPSRSRRQSTIADEYAGLDDSELRQRTMRSWMTIASNLDTTLIENIAAPPVVDQTYYEIATQPHSLHQRRASMVTTYVA
ncbi:hypothetical protein BS47DRAFT_780651 [Hydnum rufescens UP504]|uniref:Mitochondrial distribution and morphology protein 34 n=1 Tax=Hydnum rufescens UP504 TaxID=1448309 RepID=A0A9P6B0Y8_9AGAM|nr:hypothetical protein BS47DRAFT_780651 [Hydnum rufescens UP504]